MPTVYLLDPLTRTTEPVQVDDMEAVGRLLGGTASQLATIEELYLNIHEERGEAVWRGRGQFVCLHGIGRDDSKGAVCLPAYDDKTGVAGDGPGWVFVIPGKIAFLDLNENDIGAEGPGRAIRNGCGIRDLDKAEMDNISHEFLSPEELKARRNGGALFPPRVLMAVSPKYAAARAEEAAEAKSGKLKIDEDFVAIYKENPDADEKSLVGVFDLRTYDTLAAIKAVMMTEDVAGEFSLMQCDGQDMPSVLDDATKLKHLKLPAVVKRWEANHGAATLADAGYSAREYARLAERAATAAEAEGIAALKAALGKKKEIMFAEYVSYGTGKGAVEIEGVRVLKDGPVALLTEKYRSRPGSYDFVELSHPENKNPAARIGMIEAVVFATNAALSLARKNGEDSAVPEFRAESDSTGSPAKRGQKI